MYQGLQAEKAASSTERRLNLEINKAEAQHRSLFICGWRPMIGWVCAFGTAWSFLLHPIADMILDLSGSDILLPRIPEAYIRELTLGMLGFAGLRTFEKFKKVTY